VSDRLYKEVVLRPKFTGDAEFGNIAVNSDSLETDGLLQVCVTLTTILG
jgi:hypothetical protein